jgi:succinylarginine dihydrolase
MGGKTRPETAAAFLKRISGQEKDRDAKEQIEQIVELAQNQRLALSVLGTISITVVPGGAFHYAFSPHLITNRETLDWVDQALNDTQKYVRELRKRVIERDLATAQQQDTEVEVENQEESNGENSIGSPERS